MCRFLRARNDLALGGLLSPGCECKHGSLGSALTLSRHFGSILQRSSQIYNTLLEKNPIWAIHLALQGVEKAAIPSGSEVWLNLPDPD